MNLRKVHKSSSKTAAQRYQKAPILNDSHHVRGFSSSTYSVCVVIVSCECCVSVDV